MILPGARRICSNKSSMRHIQTQANYVFHQNRHQANKQLHFNNKSKITRVLTAQTQRQMMFSTTTTTTTSGAMKVNSNGNENVITLEPENWTANEKDVQGQEEQSSVLVTCEHAGNLLPESVEWGAQDLERKLNSQHWAYDPGAKEFAVELAEKLNCPAVLGKYSRLFVDLNRPVASSTLARKLCDGTPVELNKDLDQASLRKRISEYYLPYHFELERVANEFKSKTAVSVHTYTANYEGSPRDFEIGVLYSTSNEELAHKMTQDLQAAGLTAKINEPWSGKMGFMYSADCFAYNSSPSPGLRNALMLEFRNDVCIDKSWRKKVIDVIAPLLI